MRSKNRNDNIDYELSSLPTTRKEAFKDVYKHNFKTIFSSGVVLLLFSLPLFIFLIVMSFARLGITPEKYSEEILSSVLLVWDLILNAGVVLLLYLIFIALMGVMRIIKLLVWQEGINFKHDFSEGIKENFKHFSLVYLFIGLIYLVTYSVYIFLLNFVFGLALLLLFIIIFVPVLFWSMMTINVYKTTLSNYLKNAVFFYTKTVGWSLLFTLFVIWPFFLVFLPISGYVFLVKYPILLLMMVFYYPFLLVVGTLYAYSKYDFYINKDNYPEIYQKGLYNPEDSK